MVVKNTWQSLEIATCLQLGSLQLLIRDGFVCGSHSICRGYIARDGVVAHAHQKSNSDRLWDKKIPEERGALVHQRQ